MKNNPINPSVVGMINKSWSIQNMENHEDAGKDKLIYLTN
jgi:hypothetical protein